MEMEDRHDSLWIKIKLYIFMRLGESLWQYNIIHDDYWHRMYGVTFTQRRDFFKKLKYDIADIEDDLEVELAKNR
jgi:hypothetical protein